MATLTFPFQSEAEAVKEISTIRKAEAHLNQISGRVIIDVSHYVHFMARRSHVSGIQRVIQAMIQEGQNVENVIYSVRSKGQFWQFENTPTQNAEQSIDDYIDWKCAIHALRARQTQFKDRIKATGRILNGLVQSHLESISPESNDLFFIFDAAWTKRAYLNDVANLKQRYGIRIGVFLHDAIPFFGEDFVSLGSHRNYQSYLEWVNEWADVIYCNSNYSKNDLIRSGLLQKSEDAIVVPLAHEFIEKHKKTSCKRYELLHPRIHNRMKEVGAQKFALCVGTIEARKNQKLLIQAWAELRRERPMPLLVLVGKMGHRSEAFQIVLERECPPVLILEDGDDITLEYLYRHCSFTIFPSHFEGWGLPVGESLWFGKPCIASQASSIPEAGEDWAFYFDPNSLEDLKSILRRYLDGAITKPLPEQQNLRKWRDVAIDILGTLKSYAPQKNQKRQNHEFA